MLRLKGIAMYRSLLVPLDGSSFGEHALPLALSIARRAGASVQLVNVAPPLAEAYAEGVFFVPPDIQDQLVRQQRAYLESVVARLREHTAVPLSTLVLEGEVAHTLRNHAEALPADLVVMATHGRGPLGRFWLGSTTDELVRHLPMPLLLVRPEEQVVDFAREPDLSHLLLPLDGTPLAEQMIEPAVALAALMPGAEITLLRVIKPTTAVYYPPEGAAMGTEAQALVHQVQALQERLYEEAHTYLVGVADRLRERGMRVHTRVTAETQPALAVLHEAKNLHAGLVALATHGRRGLARLVLGSVADKVIRGLHGPVLVMRPK